MPLSPLERPAVLFAALGAAVEAGVAPDEAVSGALEGGATGVAATLRRTGDGVEVLCVRASYGTLRRRVVARTAAADLGDVAVALEEAVVRVGHTAELLLEVADGGGAELGAALPMGSRLWVAHRELEVLARLRATAPNARSLLVTRLADTEGGPERLASTLRDAGVDGALVPRAEWTGGLTTLFHRFGRLAVSQAAAHQRMITALLRMGIDGVISEHPDRLAAGAVEAELG